MKNTRGYTYLISNNRAYKIGITTTTVTKRIAELQTGSSSKIEISGYSYNKDALAMEQLLHNKYASKRMEGEWFDLTNDDVASIHHHFETHYLDEYLAPLSAKGKKISQREQRRLYDERLLRDLNDFKSFKTSMYITLFLVGLIIAAFTTLVNGMFLAVLASLFATLHSDKLWRRYKDLGTNKGSSDINAGLIVFFKTIKMISKNIR